MYMKMYNQAIMGRSNAGVPKYSVEYINRTASGRYPSWVYPTNDWYKLLFKDQSINHRAGVTIRGGSKVIQYYASVNYNYDQGMLKSDKLNDYDCNISNHQVGFRTNLNINLTSGIRLVINSSTNIQKFMASSFRIVFACKDKVAVPFDRGIVPTEQGANPFT